MIAYIIKVSLCWILFYALYQLLYKKISHFNINRAYLIGTLLLGVCIPVVEYISFFQSTNEVVTYFAPVMQEINQMEVQVVEVSKEGIDYMGLLFQLYMIGLIITGIRFLYGIGKIIKLHYSGEKENQKNYTLIRTNKLHLPFSFFSTVYVSKKIPLTEKMTTILQHELCHISERHTYDVMLMELCKIIFWCSPVIYLYKNAIRETHEYIADAVVLQTEDKKEYGQLLLGQSPTGIEIALAHSFFNSHLKNRITMMNQKNSSRSSMVKYFAIVPVALFLGILFMSNIDKQPTEQEAENVVLSGSWDDVLTVIAHGEGSTIEEDIDLFVGRLKADPEHHKDIFKAEYLDLRSKHLQQLNEFNSLLFSKLKDEAIGVNINIEQDENKFHFMVSANGAEEEIRTRVQKFVDNSGDNIDYSALANLVHDLNVKYPKHYEYINNELGRHSNILKKESLFMYGIKAKPQEKKKALTVAEEMPRFPGCEQAGGTMKEKEDCAKQKMLEYIYRNIKYPASARDAGVEGMVIIQFTIDKNGLVQNAEIVRDLGEGCGAEALRVVNQMNKVAGAWTPGKQDNKKVDVLWTLPVKYKLQGDTNGDQEEASPAPTSPAPPVKEKSNLGDKEVFKVVEQMPRFPGCEDLEGTQKEIENCAKEKMLQYIYDNLQYPAAAKDAGTEGMCVVQFIITDEGSIRSTKILRDIGNGAGDAAKKVVDDMNNLPERWTPGMQRGKKVNVMYTLPVRFKLESKDETIDQKVDTKQDVKEKEYRVLMDGKEVNKTVLSNINPDIIKTINIVKDEDTGVVTMYINKKDDKKDLSSENLKMFKKISNPIDDNKNDFTVILDGKEVDREVLSTIDPNDIETINVIKDKETGISTLYVNKKKGKQDGDSGTEALQFFKAFPNPIEDVLNLSFTHAIEGDLSVRILNMEGKIIRELKEDNHKGQYNKIINLDGIQSGNLIIQISKGEMISNHIITKL
jgi:TonB family protein